MLHITYINTCVHTHVCVVVVVVKRISLGLFAISVPENPQLFCWRPARVRAAAQQVVSQSVSRDL